MTSRSRINLLLLSIVVVLGALALWGPNPSEEGKRESLTPMQAGDVRRITIQRPGLEGTLRLERSEEDGWQVFLPDRQTPLPAQDFKADQIAALAEARVYDRFRVESDQLARYGLDEPRARVTLNAVEITFGGSEPLRHRRYVLLNGQVNLIDGHYMDDVAVRPADLVARALFPASVTLKEIRLPEFTVHRTEQGDWSIDPAPATPPSGDALQSFVDTWRHARAMNVHLRDASPEDELGEIILISGDGQRRLVITQRGERKRLRLWDPKLRLEYEFPVYNSERLLDPARHEPQTDEEEPDTAEQR